MIVKLSHNNIIMTGENFMEDNMIRYTLRTDKVLFRKFRYVAEYEGRSANKEIEQFIKRRVAEFEKEHGKISITDLMTMD